MYKKDKKVAIFVDSSKKSGGAYQELLYTIKKIKKENSENIKFVIIATSVKLDLNLDKENFFEIHYFSLNPISRYIAYLRNFSPFVRGIKKYFFFKNKFEYFLEKNNIDLVYFVGPSQYSLYLEDTKFFLTLPDVSVRENLEFPEIVNSSEFHRKDDVLQKSLPRALAVITNCQIIKKRISFFYGVLEERIFIVGHKPSNIISEFKTPDKNIQINVRKKLKLPDKYIFYPAMYLPHKNHKTVIDALKILKNENNHFKLVFCGNDIGFISNLKKYVKDINLNNDILFLNFINNEDLPYLYLDSSMLIMTSLIGPTNIPPWEAFKMKKPVIYSDLKGIREVLGDAVHYVDPMNPINIAQAIKKISSDEDYKNKLIEKGTEKFNENENNNNFSSFFDIIKNFRKYKKTWSF